MVRNVACHTLNVITFPLGRWILLLPPGFRIPPLRTSPSQRAPTHHCQSPKNNTQIIKQTAITI